MLRLIGACHNGIPALHYGGELWNDFILWNYMKLHTIGGGPTLDRHLMLRLQEAGHWLTKSANI